MSEIKIDTHKLVADKIVTQEIADKIENWSKGQSGDSSNKFLTIFTTIGAFVTGIGILLLIGANWTALSPMMKTILLITMTGLFYAVGYYFSYVKDDFAKTGQALTLVGSISYGASIFLLGQTYNVGGEFSSAFFLWMIGIVPLAYLTGYATIFALAIVLLHAFVFSYLSEFYTSLNGFIYALIFVVLGYINLAAMRYHENSKYRTFARILALFGAVGILGGALPFTFNDFWGWYWSARQDMSLLYFVLGGLAIGAGLVGYTVFKEKKMSFSRDLGFFIGAFPILLLSIYTTVGTKLNGGQVYSSYENLFLPFPEGLYVFAMNALYLRIVGLIVFAGIKREKAVLVNLGIIFFGFYLFGKYIAFVASNKMDGSIVFITGGVVCILIGWLGESVRRRLVKNIK